ncbi:acetate/propionate family kinase [Hyalangium sp.]|uniref:acetate/propionate family kinase n=1 Tax=Hyalangium sp. TaxID=2028555 RepID=UPI002D470D68|nr:acetate/propionate family kinase [Hyalangium sp.]HYI01240.1 acetate/propionate family kinase [Hyalangium sp.]
MKVLVINVGSTSIKYQLYEMDTEEILAGGIVERVGSPQALHKWRVGPTRSQAEIPAPTMRAGLDAVLAQLTSPGGALKDISELRAVGHRVVHGGEKLVRPCVITAEVKDIIAKCAQFAPIHNPANLAGIEAAQAALPKATHVAVFDTAFHGELPPHSYLYAVPYELYLERGVRRYGFHGPSHQFMAASASEFLKTDLSRLKLITCHLGGGASVCAIDGGRSVDTSMGMTPLEGLVMGTRSGDVDPALSIVLGRQGMTPDAIDETLNRKSGLLGLSGVSADFRDVEQSAAGGNARARLAIDVFTHRIRKYIGAYAAVLGGVDAIVFTGGIGENSVKVRSSVCDALVYMGVVVDGEKNQHCDARGSGGVVDISSPRAPTRVLVVATDEERMIAREVVRVTAGPTAARQRVTGHAIPVGVSVRHVHLTKEHCAALFGEGYELTERRPVSQPEQFVCRETVDLIGPKGEIERVAIINPLRKETQVEVSRTDAITLGVNPPLRESGKLENTPGLTLRGPKGSVAIDHGVILAHRHVHMHPDDARRFGVEDKSLIRVRVEGERETVFGDVIVRVNPQYALDMHVDTDEANAAGLTNDSVATFDGNQ